MKTLKVCLRGGLMCGLLLAFAAGLQLPGGVGSTAFADEDPPPPESSAKEEKERSPAQPIKASAWKKLRKAVPHQLWQQKGKSRTRRKRLKAFEEQGAGAVRLTRKQFAELAEMLRAGNPFTTFKKRSVTLDIPTGSTLPNGKPESMPVRVEVSSKYKPGCGRCFPLIITCHGGPMSALKEARSAAGTMFRTWSGYTSAVDCIVAAPTLTGSGYGGREWTFLTNLINTLDEYYSVDRNRILLTGHSWGGILTWHIGPPHADTFCTLAPFICAVNPGRQLLSNARALPIYHVQGSKDMRWMVDSGRARNKLLDELGHEHVYRELPGGHVRFPGEVRTISTYFLEHPRRLYAAEIVRADTRAGRNHSDLWYWIRSGTHSFNARFDAKARAIHVDIDGPFEVFLADEMFDLSEPFTIQRGDEVVFKGSVERRLDFAIDHVRETGDHGRVYAASVRIK